MESMYLSLVRGDEEPLCFYPSDARALLRVCDLNGGRPSGLGREFHPYEDCPGQVSAEQAADLASRLVDDMNRTESAVEHFRCPFRRELLRAVAHFCGRGGFQLTVQPF
jgi:hypothetical protein